MTKLGFDNVSSKKDENGYQCKWVDKNSNVVDSEKEQNYYDIYFEKK